MHQSHGNRSFPAGTKTGKENNLCDHKKLGTKREDNANDTVIRENGNKEKLVIKRKKLSLVNIQSCNMQIGYKFQSQKHTTTTSIINSKKTSIN